MDHLISMYIDNELSLDEKILFLEHAYGNKLYKNDAVSLLKQEKMLRTELNKTAPDIEFKPSRASILPFFSRSLGWAAAACLLVVLSFMVRQDFNPQTLTQLSSEPATTMHRFVIHQQDSEQVEISGSFTNWQRIPLVPTGTNGYWEISLELPAGEHRYTFIVDGSKYFPDPTVSTRESDDFGATNSILKIEA
jgi:hypothetical protein